MSLLFQLAHANWEFSSDRGEYAIKHYFLRALSLHHAHVYVTLHGYRITPEFYEDGNDQEEDTFAHPDYGRQAAEQHSVEDYERMNEECSPCEHYWHSIKQVNNYDGQMISVDNDGNELFKLSIRFQCLSADPSPHGYANLHQIEQNKNIYQFKAVHEDSLLQYVLQHVEQFGFSKVHLDEKTTACQHGWNLKRFTKMQRYKFTWIN